MHLIHNHTILTLSATFEVKDHWPLRFWSWLGSCVNLKPQKNEIIKINSMVNFSLYFHFCLFEFKLLL